MKSAMKLTRRSPEPAGRAARSRDERLAALIRLSKPGGPKVGNG